MQNLGSQSSSLARSVLPDTATLWLLSEELSLGSEISAMLSSEFGRVELLNLFDRFSGPPQPGSNDFVMVQARRWSAAIPQRISLVSDVGKLPVVLLIREFSEVDAKEITLSGVNEVLLNTTESEKIRIAIRLAKSRFEQLKQIQGNLARLKMELADRKIIEKAKGILMRQKHLTEDEAYQMLRKMAMKQNVKLASIAGKLISVADLLA